jgi:hypothetical protein
MCIRNVCFVVIGQRNLTRIPCTPGGNAHIIQQSNMYDMSPIAKSINVQTLCRSAIAVGGDGTLEMLGLTTWHPQPGSAEYAPTSYRYHLMNIDPIDGFVH